MDHQLGIFDRGVYHKLKELVDRHAIELHEPITKAVIDEIFRTAQRRYLHYFATWLRDQGGDPGLIERVPDASKGDIRTYYTRLWANFDNTEMVCARYLCGVLATLRFPVALDEVGEFQDAIRPVEIPGATRAIMHLLRCEEGLVSIFHDSFRVFVNAQIDEPTRRGTARGILRN